MLWFLRDYPLAAVLLRAATLSFQSIIIGGIVFCSILLRSLSVDEGFYVKARRILCWTAWGAVFTQVLFIAIDSAMLVGSSQLRLIDLLTSTYALAGMMTIVDAIVLLIFLGRTSNRMPPGWVWLTLPLILASIWTSHAASRLDHRVLLLALDALHQIATALWIGSLPFVWILLGSEQDPSTSASTLRRYSRMALWSAPILILAGIGMAWFYTGSWNALYGTAYGVVLIAKTLLLFGLLIIGASNCFAIKQFPANMQRLLLRIAHATELEIGIGFTIILAAASLSAQPPAVDQVQDRLTVPQIVARMTPRWPGFATPPISAMPPVQPISQAMRNYDASQDSIGSTNNATEQAWSEYNHHWAGIILLVAGICALLSRFERFRWARNWPLIFLGLAVFLFFRADPEAWPLGPRGFWQSFYNPEDLEHRLYVLLILSFVAFEWGVQTGRIFSQKAALVFPAVCALGGALLLTHSHSLGDLQEELLAAMSHTAIAICAVFAGWSRWLQVRQSGRSARIAAWIWPICLILIGVILLDYREA